ncbi:MAG: PepSY domain-containing protein [bacterium]
MSKWKIAVATSVVASILGSVLSLSVFAKENDPGEEAGLQGMLQGDHISLAEAVATAEQETGGTAIEAEFDAENGALICEVKVAMLDSGELYEVGLDPVTGEILTNQPDDDGWAGQGDDDDDDHEEGESDDDDDSGENED